MSDTRKASGPLADRISQPAASALNASSTTFSPSITKGEAKENPSWADEVASPVAGDDQSKQLGGQIDGATEDLGGSRLHDAQYDVQVKLSDIQGDVNSPLFSLESFEQLGMFVLHRRVQQACAN
jgi:ATP-dependent RNA helicase DDX19/DBP5